MRALWTCLLLLPLAGCLGGGPSFDSDDVLGDARTLWVHGPGAAESPRSAFPGEPPAFEQIHVSQRVSGEPTIAVTRTGAVFFPAIDFDAALPTGGALPRTVFLRSIDDGATWEDASPRLLGDHRTHPTSSDPYVYADPTTGRVFAVDMAPSLLCNTVSSSGNDGASWFTQPYTCPLPAVDHPTLWAGPRVVSPGIPETPGADPAGILRYPNVVYLCGNAVAATHCAKSLDGGRTWAGPHIVATDGLRAVPAVEDVLDDMEVDSIDEWLCSSFTGHGHASWADGTVYLPKADCGYPIVYVSRDEGITWERIEVAGPDFRTHIDTQWVDMDHDAMVTTDADGTAYYFWAGANGTRAFLSISEDQGRTWSDPIDVTAPGLTVVRFPSVVAGADGRVAFQYVGTTTPSGWDVHRYELEADESYEEEYLAATWHLYVGMTLDAQADEPVFATTMVDAPDRPVKRGGCWDRCFGDRGGMYDFLDLDIDPVTGRLWSAHVDVCTLECDEPGADAEATQRSFGAVGRQTGGPFLLDPEAEAEAEAEAEPDP